MRPRKRRSSSLARTAWHVVFYCSGVVFLGSLVLAICLPQFVSTIEWIYLLSLGSGITFSVAAIQRHRLTYEFFEATDDAAWLTHATHTDATDGLDLGDH